MPHQKLEELKQLIVAWTIRLSCTKRELIQLIGKLAHATKVVVPERTFQRRMIDAGIAMQHLDHDFKVWSEFGRIWFGELASFRCGTLQA